MLHILLMNDGAGKVLFITGAVFFAHLEGVENMDLCSRDVDLVRQRGDKVE